MPSVIVPITPGGPIVEVWVGVSAQHQLELRALGKPTPSPILLRLLADTGAAVTNIVAGVLDFPEIVAIVSVPAFTPSTGSQPVNCDAYDVCIKFHNALPFPWVIDDLPIVECQWLGGTIDGLPGRDVLDQSIMTYNPLTGFATLSF